MDERDQRIAELEREVRELRWLINALREEFVHFLQAVKAK